MSYKIINKVDPIIYLALSVVGFIVPELIYKLNLLNPDAVLSSTEAVIVRGKVTVLELGELKAKVVKKGTQFKKDASILTGSRSFIRIKFKDRSLASLGPKSKMVVNQVGKRKTGLISLLKGKLRTKVIKKGSKLTIEKSSHTLFDIFHITN